MKGGSSSRALFITSMIAGANRFDQAGWILPPICAYRATNLRQRRPRQTKENLITETLTSAQDREAGKAFLPKFDDAGLIAAIAQDRDSGEILMLAYMNAEALAKTGETGLAHFYSRSRGRLWMKGESSGNVLKVASIRVDCDQDAILLLVDPAGPACHTGARSCFYRELRGEGLEFV